MFKEELVFVDIETTGLESSDHILQIAAIATDSSLNEIESFEVKVQLPKKVSVEFLGSQYDPVIWQQMAQTPRRAAIRFSRFLSRHATVDLISSKSTSFQVAQLVAHNAEFDSGFLRRWYNELGLFFAASYRPLCTLQRAMWLFSECKDLTPPDNFKLHSLCQYFGVNLSEDDAHDALNDVKATVGLYRAMGRHQNAKAMPAHFAA